MPEQKTIIKQVGGYCVVQREVAQALRKHSQELGLYIFLLSLPDGWEFKKSWLQNETGVGKNKLNRMLSFLSEHNLVKTSQRKVQGKFAEFEMEVFDGKDFKPLELEPLFKSPCHRNRGTETVATEKGNKILDIKKERLKEKAFKAKAVDNSEKPKPQLKHDNETKHPWAAMKNEKAYIHEHQERKRLECEGDTHRRRDVKVAEYYLSNLKGIGKLSRYRNV